MPRIQLSIGLILLSMLGCEAEPAVCPQVTGAFTPVYTQVSGTCGPIMDPRTIAITDTKMPVQTTIVNYPNGRLTTEVVRRGCSVRLTQVFERSGDGQPQEYLSSAEELAVLSANEMSGQVTMTRYDQNQQAACWSVYNADLVKQTGTIGAAVQGATQGH